MEDRAEIPMRDRMANLLQHRIQNLHMSYKTYLGSTMTWHSALRTCEMHSLSYPSAGDSGGVARGSWLDTKHR